ncbi:MAG: sugar-binding domain-containing protein [Armatimonadota bacterium]|nr:hypothetical protein [bacterium]
MNKQVISLNGGWNVTGIDPAQKPAIDIKATVPGHIHVDLLKAGKIPDPFWRDQAEQCQWVEDWDWVYSREFTVDKDFNREWAVLEFQGLDTYGEIKLNGQVIGQTTNMHLPYRYEVGKILKPGRNQIEVHFSPYKRMIAGKPLDCYPAAFFISDRVHVRRMQCTFYWDWVHRFVSAGIWRSVNLYSYDTARVSDLFVYTHAIDRTSAALKMDIEVEKKTEEALSADIQILGPQGELVWKGRTPIVREMTRISVDVPDPKLWWPVGSGDQPLYTCKVALNTAGGDCLDTRETTFGIRTVRVERLEDQPGTPEWQRSEDLRKNDWPGADKRNTDCPGSGFTLIVNGERIMCKGGNWVPADPFPSRITPEHYDRLIKLASDGNINLLRCWGGGIYEPQEFWDACNRYGVMISQDFQMACARYPEDMPEFMDEMRKEIPAMVRKLRNNPSLVWWTGDNENGMHDDFDNCAYPGRKIADEICEPVIRELDPSRPFMPTSPYGGRPNTSLTIGDCHFTAFWDEDWKFITDAGMTNYRDRVKTVGRFMSESAICGAPPMRSLLKFMTPEDIADPSAAMWDYHTKDNPHKPDYIKYTLHGLLRCLSDSLLGPTDDIEAKVKRMGYAQYEWIRIAVESARRSKWYCSGIQFWMYNDCWPASGWSMVDYYGFPKAGYYAIKRASKPVIASIENTENGYRIWVCNDSLKPVSGELSIRVQPWQGKASWEKKCTFSAEINTSSPVLELSNSDFNGKLDLNSVLVCDLTCDAGTDRAFYYVGMPYQMNPPAAKLQVNREDGSGSGKITISSDTYGRVVTLDADLDFSDNYFELLPGEKKVVTWSDPLGSKESPEIGVSCWNAEG